MTLKTLFRTFVDAFYSPAVYQAAIQRWQGYGGRYMILLSGILGAMLAASVILAMAIFERTELPNLTSQIPPIELKNGQFEVSAEQPVHIVNQNKNFDITIDTTKTEKELRDTKTMIGIGKNFVFFQAHGNYQVKYTKEFGDVAFKLDKDGLNGLWERNAPVIKWIVWPLMWVSRFLNLVIQCVVVAILSYAVTAFMPEEFDFLTRMRLSVLALTPATVVTTLLNVTLNHYTAPWFSLLLACLYIYVMLVLIRKLPSDTAAAYESH